jgi:methionyl-tRNA formyltransferase
VRALSDPYPRAYTFYRGQPIEVIEARVSEARYGGTAGRVIVQEEGGAVVCGPDAYRGDNHGLVITRIRCADGVECSADKYFRRGGYLTSQP